jgi:hypothetical protein
VRPERDALEIRFPRVEGYRIELPEERLSGEFDDDSVLELTPDLIGATETQNSGIIGEKVDLNLVHTGDVRPSQVLYELTSHLVLHRWRDPGEEAKLHLFGQLKRIAKQWLDGYLVCKGGTYPAQLKYKMLADMACSRIIAGINRKFVGERPIKAVLDPYNPTGSTTHVNFNTSKTLRWKTDTRRCHINWVVLDSGWEGEFCRVAEAHHRVRSYVKNHNLGLEVPYRYGSEMRRYRPDFIVRVDDGRGDDDLLNLIVEIKGYLEAPDSEIAIAVQRALFVLIANLTDHAPYSVSDFRGRVVVCKLLAEAGAARDTSDCAVDWIVDAAARFSRILVDAEMLPSDDAAALQESASEMVADIQSRDGGNRLAVEDLGIFARPKHCIQLLTVHKAKGREFDAVAVIEAHDGRFPHFSIYRLQDDAEREAQYDESRRVVYVATTRAKRVLMFFSDTTDYRNTPTPFLAEMGL